MSTYSGYYPIMRVNEPTAPLAVTTSSGRVAYAKSGAGIIIITNAGSDGVFVKSGDSTVTAAVTDTYIGPDHVLVFSKDTEDTHIAAITLSGSSHIYVQAGSGI